MPKVKSMMITFKEALQEDLRGSKVPAKVVAEELEMSYSMLMNACNPDLPEFNFQARKLARFAQVTGGFHAINFIEQSLGRVSFSLPEIPDELEEIDSLVAANVREFGAALTEIGQALADRRITKVEAKRLEKTITEQVRKAMSLIESVKKVAEG